jgi:localization factor PodJL
MARATPQSAPHDPADPDPSDWRNLRNELMQLLDQVETQVSRGPETETPASEAIEETADIRHREALRSVQRAVSRVSDRDEPALPPNPRDSLEDAIQQIRASQRRAAPQAHEPARPIVPPAPHQRQEPAQPRLDAMADAMSMLTRRLEELEAEIKTQAHGQTANVKEIADQLGQLSHVVELLAGAVGEAGQVKRLEAQLGSLAKMVAEAPEVDLSGIDGRMENVARTIGTLAELQRTLIARDGREDLGERIEDVARTVERLADLQQGHAERVERIGIKDRLDDVSATVGRLADLQVQVANRLEHPNDGTKDGLRRIEESLRNVYDRVDSVEKSVALAPAEIEKVTDELAAIAAALNDPRPPRALVEQIDALSDRIAKVEGRSEHLGALKSELQSLRGTVAQALEPRFAALEQQLETLSDRMSRKLTPDPGIAQIESQVRQLVARMDQTGEQLSGLARLYSEPVEAQAPDYDAIADAVAHRTSEMLARIEPQQIAAIDDEGFAEIERRFERVLKAAGEERGPSEDFVALRTTIDEVGTRLARLEASLSIRAAEAEDEVETPVVTFEDRDDDPPPSPPRTDARIEPQPAAFVDRLGPDDASAADGDDDDPLAAVMAAIGTQAAANAEARRDAMPANPSEKAPLRDKPFPEPAAPVERRQHPDLEEEIAQLARAGKSARMGFDTEAVERPPQPMSSLESESPDLAGAMSATEGKTAVPLRGTQTSSRNTFIEAHRRAARQASARPVEPAPEGNSLIGRAFARFHAAAVKSEPVRTEPEAPTRPAIPSAERVPRTQRGRKPPAASLAGTTETANAAAPMAEPELPKDPTKAKPTKKEKAARGRPAPTDSEAGESFLLRHRKPILLAAAVVALGCLTINFLSQRLAEGPAQSITPPVTTGEAALDPTPIAKQKVELGAAADPGQRAIPMLDPTTTGGLAAAPADARALTLTSTGPAADSFSKTETIADDTAPAVVATTAPDTLTGPIKVEMPAEGVGPEALRQAAAEGDARAQFEVGAIFTEGRAVPQDLDAAAKWYERAAAQGFAPAQYRLGSLYEHGEGVDKDLAQARLWYERAAEAGNRMAMHNLAALYAGGNLGKQQFDAAAKWFEEAATRGLTDSQFNLGMLYARGLGVTQSLDESYKWFALAAAKGDADAAKARDDIASSLDAATVQRLNDVIKTWTPAPLDLVANYAPIGTWQKDFDPGATISTRDVVVEVQKALEQLGYDIGTPDGIAGPKTADAIRAFERGTGMTESGAVNPRLLAVLGSQPA